MEAEWREVLIHAFVFVCVSVMVSHLLPLCYFLCGGALSRILKLEYVLQITTLHICPYYSLLDEW